MYTLSNLSIRPAQYKVCITAHSCFVTSCDTFHPPASLFNLNLPILCLLVSETLYLQHARAYRENIGP